MSKQNSNTGTGPSGPEEEEDRIPQPADETTPEDPEESGGSERPEEASEERPEGTGSDQENAGPQEDGPETDSAQEEESQGEESDAEEPNGHLKINLTIGDDGRTTVGIKRHDTDLFMTTILASELDDVLKQVPELTGRAEARWTLEKMNPAYNRNPKSSKAKNSKPKAQTNQNRSNPVSAPATRQTSLEGTPPPDGEAETPAEPQAEPLRLF